jgi:MinD superfamily P-loop ATPase
MHSIVHLLLMSLLAYQAVRLCFQRNLRTGVSGAADLHLIFEPKVIRREDFSGGSKARIKPGHCTACGKCEELCRFDAIYFDGPGNGRVSRTFRVEAMPCEGCGVCVDYCAENAIEFAPSVCGQWLCLRVACYPKSDPCGMRVVTAQEAALK